MNQTHIWLTVLVCLFFSVSADVGMIPVKRLADYQVLFKIMQICIHFTRLYLCLQLIRWAPQMAVCGSICVWVWSKKLLYVYILFQFPKLQPIWQHFQASFHFACFIYVTQWLRRKRAALLAWRPLEAKKSRRRKFFWAWLAPWVSESASAVVRPRNPESTSVTSNQDLCLLKLD